MVSHDLSVQYIKQQPRWDFRYYDPKYLEAAQALERGKYPLEPLGGYTKRIANFGAYSLCNLLVWVNEGIPYLRVTDLREDRINWPSVLRITPEVHDQLPKSKVYSGDVLYSMAGTIGLAVVVPDDLGECNSNQAIAQIQLKHDSAITAHYLAAFLNSRFGRYQSERIANGQTVLNINLGEIGNLHVPIPPRPIQDRIAQIMQDAYATRQAKLTQAQRLIEGIDGYLLAKLGIELDVLDDMKHFVMNVSKLQGQRFDIGPYANQFSIDGLNYDGWVSLEELAQEATQRRDEAKKLWQEAESVVSEAKELVERMILGEEAV